MESRTCFASVVSVALLLSACGSKGDAQASPEPTSAATGSASVSDSPKSRLAERAGRAGARMAPVRGDTPLMKAVLSPAEEGYSEASIKLIGTACRAPWVLLSTAPPASGDDYAFPSAQQAFLANPLLQVVDGEPSTDSEVELEVHKKGDYFLIARCHEATHCNKVAAMYKANVKTSSPETGCSDLPRGLGASTKLRALSLGLPDKADTSALCARLGACRVAKDPRTSEDPSAACQKSPSSFKTACALKSSCDEVLACLAG